MQNPVEGFTVIPGNKPFYARIFKPTMHDGRCWGGIRIIELVVMANNADDVRKVITDMCTHIITTDTELAAKQPTLETSCAHRINKAESALAALAGDEKYSVTIEEFDGTKVIAVSAYNIF